VKTPHGTEVDLGPDHVHRRGPNCPRNIGLMKLFSRLFVLCRNCPKDDKITLSPFWGSYGPRSTLVDGSLESPCRVLVKRKWTSFSISYGWGATRQNVSRLAAIMRG